MTITRDTLRKLESQLDGALDAYVYNNGSKAWDQADEYRDDGFALAEKAFAQTEEDPQVFIEDGANKAEEGSGYLVLCAAEYRLAELQYERANKADAFFNLAAQITGAA